MRAISGINSMVYMPKRVSVRGGREYTAVSFGSVPQSVRDQVTDLAQARGLKPRDIYAESVEALLADIRGGEEVVFMASPKDAKRLQVWLPSEAADQLEEACRGQVTKTAFLLTAITRYLRDD